MRFTSCSALLIVAVVAILGGSRCCLAWWDEGHMLVATIADSMLSEPERRRIISELLRWGFDLPVSRTSLIAAAAVWPDHIKCGSASPEYCRGGKYLDALEVFNKWHYVDNVYNPDRVRLLGILNYYPLPETGAVWALDQLAAGFLQPSEQPNLTAESARPNRHAGFERYPPVFSIFGWNFRLRNVIHILGDLHQPLHSLSAVSWLYPSGDAGGSRVAVDVSTPLVPSFVAEKIFNLHALWDSCGGLYHRSLPDIPVAELVREAMDIMRKFPASDSVGARWGFHFKSAEAESEEFARNYAYPEVLHYLRYQFASCTNNEVKGTSGVNNATENETPRESLPGSSDSVTVPVHDVGATQTEVVGGASVEVNPDSCPAGFVPRPFRPSDRYIINVQYHCRERIARAGYRLADVLKHAVQAMWQQDQLFGFESGSNSTVPKAGATVSEGEHAPPFATNNSAEVEYFTVPTDSLIDTNDDFVTLGRSESSTRHLTGTQRSSSSVVLGR